MSLQSTYLTTTSAPIYTSSGSSAAMTFYVANYSNVNATFSIWAVQNGGSPSNINVMYSNVTVLAGDTYLASTERIILDNGDRLYARCNANSAMSVTLTYTSV